MKSSKITGTEEEEVVEEVVEVVECNLFNSKRGDSTPDIVRIRWDG